MQEVSLKNILADQKVAATFLDKVLDRDYSLNGPKYRDINPKDFFDLNNKYSKFSYDEKLSILKYHLKSKSFYSLWSPGKVLYENNPVLFDDPEEQKAAYNKCLQAFIDQRTEIDKIIDSLPDEYHDELDTFYTELTCHSLGVLLAYDRESLFYEVFLKYLESQLKLSEEQNWPSEKKAVIQKWIAYCEEKIKPSKGSLDKKAKNGKFVDLYSYFLKDEKPLDLAQLEGILNAKFHDRSVVVNLSTHSSFFNPFKLVGKMVKDGEIKAEEQENYKDIDYEVAKLVVKKFCFDEILNSAEEWKNLYLGQGPYEYVPLEIRMEIAATTSVLKTLDDWYKFIFQIKQDERNPKMDAAFLSSLPKEEFNYNLYDVLDCIVGEKEIKIQEPLQSEQSYDDEADIVHESYKKQNSVYQPSPAPVKKLEKEEEQEQPNWFIKFILCIAKIFGIKTAFGYYTNTYKKIASATPANIRTNVYTKLKLYSKTKNVKQSKNEIPKTMVPGQKNISSLQSK